MTAEQLRAAILTAMRADAQLPRGERRLLVDVAVAVAQPEIGQAHAAGMREAAAMLRRYCPNHGPDDVDTAFMDCHCAGADEIDRDAAALSARPGCPDPIECDHEAEVGQLQAELAGALATVNQLRAELAAERRAREIAAGRLLHFAAEAHRRKWAHDNGDEKPASPAFTELHHLGNEMRTAVDQLAAAVSAPTT